MSILAAVVVFLHPGDGFPVTWDGNASYVIKYEDNFFVAGQGIVGTEWEGYFAKWIGYMDLFSSRNYTFSSSLFGDSKIEWTSGSDCEDPNALGCTNRRGITTNGWITYFEIYMNLNDPWTENDWESVATHEAGHAIGLGHCSGACPCTEDEYPTMRSGSDQTNNCYDFGRTIDKPLLRTLSAADVARVGAHYVGSTVGVIDHGHDDDGGGDSHVTDARGDLLLACYPNPFNPVVNISFFLPVEGKYDIVIYDLGGRSVFSFPTVEGVGVFEIMWNGVGRSGKRLPSGHYIVTVSSESFFRSVRVTMLK